MFLFGLSAGLRLNNNSNSEFNSNESSITLVNSLRGSGKSESSQNIAFVQTPPGQRYSGEQSINDQYLREMPTKIRYKTALSGGKKLPDNPGGGSSWNGNNQDNEDEIGKIYVVRRAELTCVYLGVNDFNLILDLKYELN